MPAMNNTTAFWDTKRFGFSLERAKGINPHQGIVAL